MNIFKLRGLLISVVVLLSLPSLASANLCRDKHISVRDAQEAAHLATLPFSDGAFAGNAEYDALVIGCNRKRDSREKMIEESFQPTEVYPNDLPAKLIKGTISYYGKFPIRYGYELSRVNGEWLVTIPLKFDFDTPNHPDTLDIPMELARELDLAVEDGVCDDSNRNNMTPNQVSGNGFILRGVYEDTGGHIGDDSCRLPKTFTANDQSIQTLLADFWTRSINEFWTRPGVFKMNAINYDDLSISERNRYRSAKSYWSVEFNSRPQSRALYKPIISKPTPLYSGEPAFVIVHEFGHALGLDDEYKEGKDGNKPWRDCEDRSSPFSYVMCKMPNPGQTGGVLGDLSNLEHFAKGVYYWLITRRYEAETCKQNSDCAGTEYCATGAIKNHCKTLKVDGDSCSANKQCGSGLSCVNKPAGSCVFENSRTMNQSCRVNEQCTTGKCQGTGRSRACVCNSKEHCPDGSYCRNRAGKNECRIQHSEYSSCSSNSQCGAGMTCNNKPVGHCISTTTKALGTSCEYNAECSTGKCQGSGNNRMCVCNTRNHCDDGEYCNKRAGQKNRCLADASKAMGASCATNGECITNKCEQNICVCRNNNDCPGSQKCKTPVNKKNFCR